MAAAFRGRWAGNRGCLHDGRQVVRHHRGRRWIVCETSFRGRWSPQWRPGRFTWLYFFDEAVAFAAGHRPCAQCRYRDYRRFVDLAGARSADQLDDRLHEERWDGHAQRRHSAPWSSVPPGAFVLDADVPALVLADLLVPWTIDGYGSARSRPRSGSAVLLTPPSTCEVLRRGYEVQIDESAANSPR